MSIEPIRKSTPKVRERKLLRAKPHTVPASVKQAVFDAAGSVCEWCGVPGGALVIHHKRLRSQGGKDRVEDCAALHQLCHTAVHARPTEARRRGLIIGAGSNL